MHKSLNLSGRLASFRFAFRGILTMVKTQRNAWIHAAATVAVCGIGVLLGLSAPEWCWLVLAMGLLLMNFPGKYRLERFIVSRGPVLRGINWIRHRWKVEPLDVNQMEDSS